MVAGERGVLARLRFVVAAAVCHVTTVAVCSSVEFVTLVDEAAPIRYRTPSDATEDEIWMDLGFDDSEWKTGALGIGYDSSCQSYCPFLATEVLELMRGVTATIYIRTTFEAPPESLVSLVLSVRYDDGFVAYLNGVEVAQDNAPEVRSFDSRASATHPDIQAVVLMEFNITEHIDLLNPGGSNVLAIHGMNASIASADLLFDVRLSGETAPVGPDPFLPILSITRTPDHIRLTSFFDPCLSVGVEYSPDLSTDSWIDLGNFLQEGSEMVFLDPDPVHRERRAGYYRTILRPPPP